MEHRNISNLKIKISKVKNKCEFDQHQLEVWLGLAHKSLVICTSRDMKNAFTELIHKININTIQM